MTIADNQTKEVDNLAQYFMKCLVYGTAKSSYENIIKYGHLNPRLLSGLRGSEGESYQSVK